jgi:hypothetical protein
MKHPQMIPSAAPDTILVPKLHLGTQRRLESVASSYAAHPISPETKDSFDNNFPPRVQLRNDVPRRREEFRA